MRNDEPSSAMAQHATVTASGDGREALAALTLRRVGRYELGDMIGAGGMGIVYRASDPDLGRPVAIKICRARGGDPARRGRVLREAQAMARLRHANVLPIFDAGLIDDAVFVAMPLVTGGTLRTWMRAPARTAREILDKFIAAGHGLAAAHAAGIIHRDFKPDNVLLGDGAEVLVADFGLAQLTEDAIARSHGAGAEPGSLTLSSEVRGTPAYMAPEQLRDGAGGAPADQFSFCVSLWEGLFGDRPFPDAGGAGADPIAARLAAITAGPARPRTRSDLPRGVRELLARGLCADPAARWPSLAVLIEHLQDHLHDHLPRARPRWLLAVGALLAIGALIAAATLGLVERRARGPMSAPPSTRRQLTHDADLTNAMISPDGQQLAVVAGGALSVRGGDGADQILIAHGVSGASIAWSPDATQLLVAMDPDDAPAALAAFPTELVTIATRGRRALPIRGLTALVANDTAVVTTYTARAFEVVGLDDPTRVIARCPIPGTYDSLRSIEATSQGNVVVQTWSRERGALVILARDCRVLGRFDAVNVAGVGTTDTGTILALSHGDGVEDLRELSTAGEVLTRRQVSGELEDLLGRRHGTDFVFTLAQRTHLERLHASDPPRPELTVAGGARFALSPSDATVAWIELGGRARPRGPLRTAALAQLAARGRALIDNAVAVTWSPDGASLAVIVDDDHGIGLVVMDRRGGGVQHVPLAHLDPAQPLWIGDARVAARLDDRSTYRWFDLRTHAQGDLVDRSAGRVAYATSAPDGTVALFWSRSDGSDVWLVGPDRAARPLHLADAARYPLIPSWTGSGALATHNVETGVLAHVALDTGVSRPFARVPRGSMTMPHADHLMVLPDGDILLARPEYGINVSAIGP